MEYHPLSAVRDCLFNTFSATLDMWRPYPPSATRERALSKTPPPCPTHSHTLFLSYNLRFFVLLLSAMDFVLGMNDFIYSTCF